MTRFIFDQSLGYLNTKHSFFSFTSSDEKNSSFLSTYGYVDLLYMHFTCTFLR